MRLITIMAAAAFAIAGTVANASTIALNTAVAPEAVNTIPGQDFQAQLIAAGATHLYSGPLSLISDGPVKVSFSLVAAESNFRNSLLLNGSTIITENGGNGGLANFQIGELQSQTFTFNFAGGDLASLLSFGVEAFNPSVFTTFTAGQPEFGIFANSAELGALTTFYLALDDDGANSDDNHDDIIVRVNISPVPLPASGLLLLAGLGGIFGARRFRRKA